MIPYDTRCYFNVLSTADMSQLNLPHGNNAKVENRKTKNKKQVCSKVSVNSAESVESVPEEEKEGYGGKDLQKRKVLCLE